MELEYEGYIKENSRDLSEKIKNNPANSTKDTIVGIYKLYWSLISFFAIKLLI